MTSLLILQMCVSFKFVLLYRSTVEQNFFKNSLYFLFSLLSLFFVLSIKFCVNQNQDLRETYGFHRLCIED